jgi:hypothetical protein
VNHKLRPPVAAAFDKRRQACLRALLEVRQPGRLNIAAGLRMRHADRPRSQALALDVRRTVSACSYHNIMTQNLRSACSAKDGVDVAEQRVGDKENSHRPEGESADSARACASELSDSAASLQKTTH